ncbi:MAG: 1,2-phenylacetyl-CoA epoxidase subunit PaaC, partial [Flavisolibacter sp.]
RDEHQYLNLLITELPKGDWAFSILRQYLFSAFQYYQYTALQDCKDEQLSAISEKSIKEVAYHLRWAGEWVIRLGDGTEESHDRIKKALNEVWMYTGEMFEVSTYEAAVAKDGLGVDPSAIKDLWATRIQNVLREATLKIPKTVWMQTGGKHGKHTEQLGYLLAEMQYLQRTYPNSTW